MPNGRKSPAEFFDDLQSVAKLIGDLAANVADAQDRLDTSYVRNLAAYLKAIGSAVADLPDSEARSRLLLALAPSRYQFTETTVEVRADLQMTSARQIGVSANLGYRTPVLAAAVNASYVKRSGYDYRASAFIRSVLHAVPADPAVMQTLLEAARTAGGGELPAGSRYAELASALGDLPPIWLDRPDFAAGQGDPELEEFEDELARGDAPPVDDPEPDFSDLDDGGEI